MLSSTVQCFVHLSRFGPCPCYPYPEPEVHPHWESQSKPMKRSRKYIKNAGCKCGQKQTVLAWQFFIPYTRPMAVGFGLTTILASIQLNLSLLGSSGSSVRLSGQPTMMQGNLPSFLTTVDSLMKVHYVKTYLVGPSLPGKISWTFIQPMKYNRTNNTSVPRLIMHSDILYQDKISE